MEEGEREEVEAVKADSRDEWDPHVSETGEHDMACADWSRHVTERRKGRAASGTSGPIAAHLLHE
jgi:hypothetical protein